ncbi:MAG: hypothetical protein HFG20_02680 [Anaerotruncus sp.]|nr:hypothetical protein [Anaerotruncus sp.]
MLTPQIGQEITQEATKIIKHGVLITDENGFVIGSSDPRRIGTLHEASLEVIRSRKPAFLDAEGCLKYRGTRYGVTFPIELSGEVVGSVGITGMLEEVSQFGQLIKMFVEVFLKERVEQELSQLREQSLYNLLVEIISYREGDNEEDTIRHAQAFGYDLRLPRVALVVETQPQEDPAVQSRSAADIRSTLRRVFTDQQDICVTISINRFVVFAFLGKYNDQDSAQAAAMRKAVRLAEELRHYQLDPHVGIGMVASDVAALHKSYGDAYQALQICKWNKDNTPVLFIRQSYLERLIFNISNEAYQTFYEDNLKVLVQQKDGQELLKVVLVWCECKFNATEAAQQLHIHKNTLAYRLNRIKKVSGLDLRDFKEALALYLAVTLYYLKRDKPLESPFF